MHLLPEPSGLTSIVCYRQGVRCAPSTPWYKIVYSKQYQLIAYLYFFTVSHLHLLNNIFWPYFCTFLHFSTLKAGHPRFKAQILSGEGKVKGHQVDGFFNFKFGPYISKFPRFYEWISYQGIRMVELHAWVCKASLLRMSNPDWLVGPFQLLQIQLLTGRFDAQPGEKQQKLFWPILWNE